MDAASPLSPAAARFAQRLFERDQPPPPPTFDEASIKKRLRAGVSSRFPALRRPSVVLLADILYGLMAEPVLVLRALATTLGRNPKTITLQLAHLLTAGLLEHTVVAGDRRITAFRLTRPGEDWVQSLVQVPLPPDPIAP